MVYFKAFIAALQFLTRLPFHWVRLEADDFGKGLAYFPMVGLIIGALTGISYEYLLFLPHEVAAAIILLLHVILTGGLHWDGLMDTIDGIFSARERDKILEIMKDSRVGAHGVTGAVMLFLLKFTLLLALPEVIENFSMVIILASISMLARWSMAIAILAFPYAKKQGLGTFFREKANRAQLIFASLSTIIIVYLSLSLTSILLIISALVFMYLFSISMTRMLGGMTGDTYGALCELEEIILLTTAVVIFA